MEAKVWATSLLVQIDSVVKEGLPEVYEGDIEAFLSDWSADWPWTEPMATEVAEAMAVLPQFAEICRAFEERYRVRIEGEGGSVQVVVF